MNPIKKVVFTLNIGNYAPNITAITYPLLKYYADKIGAQFFVITERKFPQWPVTYEKLQIHELMKEFKADWGIYIDSDAMIHPQTPDWTCHLKKDTIAHWASDMANIRFRYNEYFLRDGRHWAPGNWFAMASDWCLDLWRPLDMTPEEAISQIRVTMEEAEFSMESEHLIDDYALACNVARFGLKTKRLKDLTAELEMEGLPIMHLYRMTEETKERKLKEMLSTWHIPEYIINYGSLAI